MRPVVLVVDWMLRPHTSNAERQKHWRALSRIHKAWREAGAQAAMISGVRSMPPCEVSFQGRYKHKPLPDAGALAPTGKCLIDGMVDFGVWPDDDASHVVREVYLPPIHDPSLPDAVIITLTPETP